MSTPPALSVIVPALNAETSLAATLASVAAAAPLETIVVDGGSADGTRDIATACGATVLTVSPGRGGQLAAGAAAARGTWLLFLHADTELAAEAPGALRHHMSAAENFDRAGIFEFRLDDPSPQARRIERVVAWRTRALGLPYGDQGLLISRALYDEIGGFRPLPLMEDVDIIRRLGRWRLVRLGAAAITSAARYRAGGWWARPARNLFCLSLYFAGVPPHAIARIYR